MPPSPAMRISPRRELRAENHKRGRSLENVYREKDDDLALFNEVQHQEKEDFLLQSNDDFDDLFATKLKSFSDYKLGISIPARGESSDLLNAEGDKNDYDWLITPPETPLFSSLDDETAPVNLARGRPRSQPVSISRSSTMEKSYRSGRGSPSPHRLSPSPRSGNSTLESRSRPFSATHSSPPPTLRQFSPSRGVSPPPSKPKPAARSSTPTPGRRSTGSVNAAAPSRVRGTSPIKTTRGNSASPKLKAWQCEFSTEAPPNLRTSLADRPASYVRGSSPASRSDSRSARQSMSPTATRSVSSSHSHDRDPFSSYSKGSVASSGDDDGDSLQSMPISSSDRSAPRSIGTFPSSRTSGFSKKPTKTLSSSAPKRSFDAALRQMDRKIPQNMFRPLLSSVPSSTIYVGKTSLNHRSLTSRNSSITTSSNASSDQGTSGAHDTEESEQNQEDVSSSSVKGRYSNLHSEVFVMDQDDALNEDLENRLIKESIGSLHDEIDNSSIVNSQSDVADIQLGTAMAIDEEYDRSDVGGTPDALLCSKCKHRFPSGELLMEEDIWLCLECKRLDANSTLTTPLETLMVSENMTGDFVQVLKHRSLEILDRSALPLESSEATGTGVTGINHLDSTINDGPHSYNEPSHNLEILLVKEDDPGVVTEQVDNLTVNADSSNQQLQPATSPGTKVDNLEVAGISLLLKPPSSGKRYLIQSRSFTASNKSYDDFSSVKDSLNSLRSSTGRSTASLSSSVDLVLPREIEARVHRQLSGRKSDVENYRYEMPPKHKRSSSSLSGASSQMFQPSVAPTCHEDNFGILATSMDKGVSGATCLDLHEQPMASEFTEAESSCSDVESNSILKADTELSSHKVNEESGDSSTVLVLASEDPASHEKDENLTNTESRLIDRETASEDRQTSTQGENPSPSSCADVEVVEVQIFSSLVAISETEIENARLSTDSKSDVGSANSDSSVNELLEPSVSMTQNDVEVATAEESDISSPAHGGPEKSRVVLEGDSTNTRSMTLEEATDAILFCSSIVHNIAYEAANIAIDKENPPADVLRPTMTYVGRSSPDRREMRSKPTGKRNSKSQKNRQRKSETDTKPPPIVAETDEKSTQRIIVDPNKGDSMKPPPKLESKCNCTIM